MSDTASTMELEVYEPAGMATLFGTADPKLALERMAEVAASLVDVIEKKRLYATISGRRHVTVDGWQTLGGMVGVNAIIEWTRPLPDGNGWEARAEARTLDGRLVGAAESMCSRAEKEWGPSPSRGKPRDDFALRGMAQTRAIGRALRGPLGQIVVLAGYEAATAEEMPAEEAPTPPAVDMNDPDIPFGDAAVPGVNQPPKNARWVTEPQKRKLNMLIGELRNKGQHITTEQLWAAIAKQRGVPSGEIDAFIESLRGRHEDGVLHWSPLRDSLNREEARWLIDKLEEKSDRVKLEQGHDPATAPFPEGY